jgi:SdrD B-like domain
VDAETAPRKAPLLYDARQPPARFVEDWIQRNPGGVLLLNDVNAANRLSNLAALARSPLPAARTLIASAVVTACTCIAPAQAVQPVNGVPLAPTHREIVLISGQTVGEIVERLAPNGRAAFQEALAAVMALNQGRFPGGQVSRVGPGFKLWVPARLADGTVLSTAASVAPTQAMLTTDKKVALEARGTHLTDRTATLAQIAASLFPDNPGATENALTDLKIVNAATLTPAQRSGSAVVSKGTRLVMAPWMVTALSTPLPSGSNSANLQHGVYVAAPAELPTTLATKPSNGEQQMAAAALPITAPKSAVSPAAIISDANPSGETVIAQVTTLDRAQAEEDRLRKQMEGKPKAYVDKVLDASALPTQRDDNTEQAPLDAPGFRGYLVESRLGIADGTDSARATEFGLRTEYRHETLNHGEFVAQADVRTRRGDAYASIGLLTSTAEQTSARVTLRNLGFPLTTQMFADTALGDQLVQVTDAFGRAYRLSLGSGTVRGLSTHIFSRELDVRVGAGERGVLAGGPYPGFERTSGMLAWLGATQRFGKDAFFGAQFSHATGLQSLALPGASEKYSVNSGAFAIGYGTDLVDAGSSKARMTIVGSNRSNTAPGEAKSGAGVFMEAGMRAGGYRHEFGVYWAQQGLMFGDTNLSGDNRGAYWRVDRNAGRLFWGVGLDFEDTNPSQAATRLAQRRIGLNGNAQYRLDRDSSVGGSVNASDVKYLNSDVYPVTGDGTRSYNTSLFYQTRFVDWGRSRLTATLRHNQTLVANDLAASGQELQWEHDWVTGKFETMRPEFVTTLGYARDTSGGQVQTYPTAGVQWKYWWDADWSIGGNLRYTSRTGNLATSRGLSGAFNSEKIFNNGWRMGLQGSINEARVSTTAVPGGTGIGTSIGNIGSVNTTRSNSKSVFLYVRWEGASGAPYSALGLRTAGSAGSGGVSGIVYFDANRDGSQQADERGVPNVEVVLDGRYRVTTDRDGRFEFPLVPTGQHRITLVLESVPLPWGAALERGLGVDVPLRGVATANIPVVKVGE